LLKLGYLIESLEYEKLAGNNFIENELKRILKSKHEYEKEKDPDAASTHVGGVSNSQSRKTSESEIQITKKKQKKPKEEEKPEFNSKYEELLIKMAEEVNLQKEKLLGFLEVKKKPEDFENGIIITSGVNKILRYHFFHEEKMY